MTYSKETGKKLSKHRDAGFGGVSGSILGNPIGGEKTVDFSKGRGLGKTMVTKDVSVYKPDKKARGVDAVQANYFPSDTKTATATRGQMIKKGAKTTAKGVAGWGLAYPALGADIARFTAQNPKELASEVVSGAAKVTAAVPYVGIKLAQHGLQKLQGGIEKVGKKIGSKVKNVATNVRKKRLAKKTK